VAGHDEEVVGEAVQVADDVGPQRLGGGQADGEALGAAADGTGEVEVGGDQAAAGEDEAAQLGEGLVPGVDLALEGLDVAGLDDGLARGGGPRAG
jgi:hypothetical protein